MDQNEIGRPSTRNEEVNENIARIKAFLQTGTNYLSTSQQVMVGLALCRPDLLAKAQFAPEDIELAWNRLDDVQREAVVSWFKNNTGAAKVNPLDSRHVNWSPALEVELDNTQKGRAEK